MCVLVTCPLAALLAHTPHEHGVAHVELVQEGDTVDISLRADGDGVVGFEHASRDAAERDALERAGRMLAEGAALIQLTGQATCRLVNSDVVPPGALPHEDWQAHYRFSCARGASVIDADFTGLFATFPGLRRLQLQWITDAGQSAAELHPDMPRIGWRTR